MTNVTFFDLSALRNALPQQVLNTVLHVSPLGQAPFAEISNGWGLFRGDIVGCSFLPLAYAVHSHIDSNLTENTMITQQDLFALLLI